MVKWRPRWPPLIDCSWTLAMVSNPPLRIIKAIISSDFGIGWDFTNWDAPWYLGEQIHKPDFPLAHHQLLALHAPRSFLVIAGQADRPASWQYIQAAQEVHGLYGKKDAAGCFDHGTGHQPTEESIRLAYQWLAEQFDLVLLDVMLPSMDGFAICEQVRKVKPAQPIIMITAKGACVNRSI